MNTKNRKVKSEVKPLSEEKETTELQEETANASESAEKADIMADVAHDMEEVCQTENWELKYNELNDSHLRLMAEFDNYRKRTLREKTELIKNGGETALTNLLPVIDDFERALGNSRQTEDLMAVIQGIELIYNKFISYLAQQGVKPVEAIGKPFDTEQFEAIATIPVPEESQKGKVLDCIQTGYVLNEKVIRHAKVVVGE
ncbi:MAG: nucleotide exchange factor GrpE [Tannerella sp.]|jgi:molecular chaperone GrpE|nr:nucleotide exchange factor GrpE [Tannerella sp.]